VSDRGFLLVYIALVVLLPMVPAITLFKLLPSRAAVKGPFKGLKINLGGAFAAYFIVLLLLLGVFRTPPQTQSWVVKGKVHFSDQGNEVAEAVRQTVRFSLIPPPERVRTRGDFDIRVCTNTSDLPDLRVEASGYQPVTRSVEINSIDRKRQTVNITEPFELRRQPDKPYKPAKALQADEEGQ
jgi:hypothetical protein